MIEEKTKVTTERQKIDMVKAKWSETFSLYEIGESHYSDNSWAGLGPIENLSINP